MGLLTQAHEAIAVAIAVAGVGALLARGLALSRRPAELRYRPSVNARVPLL